MGRTALRWFLALCLLGGLTLPAPPARAASPVWSVHGAHATVYLAGSVHLLQAQDARLPAGFERAYADSATLVMEIDLARLDPAQIAGWMARHGSLPAGTSLRSVLGEPRYARLSAAAETLSAPMAVFDSQAPWAVGVELADFEYLHLGFDPSAGVEEQLLRRAQSDGKATNGLETVNEELGGLEALSPEDQLRLLDQTLSELGDANNDLQKMLLAWRRGDTPTLAAILDREFRGFPTLYRPLVTVRNQRWLPQIEQLLQADKNSLVVVGALHLVGPGGLLELLRKAGYRPQQLN